MEYLGPFNEMMWHLFMGLQSEQHFEDAIEALKDPHLNIYDNDMQLFCEIRAGRWYRHQCQKIYNTLEQCHNYNMTALDIDCLDRCTTPSIHFFA